MKKGKVFVNDVFAGYITQDESGYSFYYVEEYLSGEELLPVSLTLPLTDKVYKSDVLFPFFDGLIPEGYLLNVAIKHFGVDRNNRMDLLLKVCKDVAGNVSIEDVSDE